MSKLFHGGLPAKPEVDKLLAAFGEQLEEKRVITYEEISAACGVEHGTSRWMTVTKAWRDYLRRNYHTELGASTEVKDAFVVLDPPARIEKAQRWVKAGVRKMVRSATIAATTDQSRLSVAERLASDWVQRMAGKAKCEMALASRKVQVALPEPVRRAAG